MTLEEIKEKVRKIEAEVNEIDVTLFYNEGGKWCVNIRDAILSQEPYGFRAVFYLRNGCWFEITYEGEDWFVGWYSDEFGCEEKKFSNFEDVLKFIHEEREKLQKKYKKLDELDALLHLIRKELKKILGL